MSNLDRITNRLSALVVALEENPHPRVQMAVEDCLDPDIDDKDRTYAYGYARKMATRFGYEDYLPKSGSRQPDPVLAPAIAYINKTFTTFVQAGLKACPDILEIMRPKKNKAGIINYTQDTLITTLTASCEKWHTDAYKNKLWDGQVDTMSTISLPTTEEVDSEE